MYLRYKKRGEKRYWSIVRSIRKEGKPRQKIINYLGNAETILEKIKRKKK